MTPEIKFDAARTEKRKEEMAKRNAATRRKGIAIFALSFVPLFFIFMLCVLGGIPQALLDFADGIPAMIFVVSCFFLSYALQKLAEMVMSRIERTYPADILYSACVRMFNPIETYIEREDTIARLCIAYSNKDGVISRDTVCILAVKENANVSVPVACLEDNALYVPFESSSASPTASDPTPEKI